MSGTAPASEKAARFALLLLVAAVFVVSLDSRVITPLLPAIAEDFDSSISRAGLIVTAYLLPYGLFQLLYGPVADRVGRIRVISVALGVFALGCILCAVAPTLEFLVVLRFLTGVSAAAVIPMTLAYIGDTVPYEQRQAAIGMTVMSTSMGQILSSAVGGLLAAFVSWRAIFAIDGVIALVITVILLRQPLARAVIPAVRRSALAPYRIVLADRRHVAYYALIFVEGAIGLGAFAYFGALLRERDGFSFTTIGIYTAIFGLGSLLVGRYIGRIAGRLGEQRMIAFGGAGGSVGFVLVTLQPSAIIFPFAMLLMGAAFIMMHSTLQTRATELAPTARGTGIALFAFSLFLGSSLGAILTAMSLERIGYNETMLILAGIFAAFTATMTLTFRAITQPHYPDEHEQSVA